MRTKSVRQNSTPSPLAGEGWDGGESSKRPPPHASPARGEEARRNTGEGWDGGIACRPPHLSPPPRRGEEKEKSTGDGKRYAQQLRRHPTEAEQALWRFLRLRQIAGYKFRRQQPLGPYIVDFVCLEARLIIEIDGGQHATSTKDTKRTAWLESNNFQVMRFWNHEVMVAPGAVMTAIEHALMQPPHLDPPPQGGRKTATALKGTHSA